MVCARATGRGAPENEVEQIEAVAEALRLALPLQRQQHGVGHDAAHDERAEPGLGLGFRVRVRVRV